MRRFLFVLALAVLAFSHTVEAQTLPSFDESMRAIRYNSVPNVYYSWDDYVQYSPFAVTLGLKVAGYEGRSSWGRMIVSDAISAAVMVAAVGGLKYAVRRPRPDGSDYDSFPSGHAAKAFTMASIMHKEYGWRSPWFSFGAYSLAAVTGVSRLVNDRHYATDVIAGAVIGTAAVQLGYFLADQIFKDRYLAEGFQGPDWTLEREKRYYELGMYFGYRFAFGGPCSVSGSGVSGGAMAGLDLRVPIKPRWSAFARLGTGSLGVRASYNVYEFLVGGGWNWPFAKVLEFEAKAFAGYSLASASDICSGFDFTAETSLAVMTGDNFKIKAFAGYAALRNTRQKPFMHLISVGGSAVFFW